jgi:hypothetical protein
MTSRRNEKHVQYSDLGDCWSAICCSSTRARGGLEKSSKVREAVNGGQLRIVIRCVYSRKITFIIHRSSKMSKPCISAAMAVSCVACTSIFGTPPSLASIILLILPNISFVNGPKPNLLGSSFLYAPNHSSTTALSITSVIDASAKGGGTGTSFAIEDLTCSRDQKQREEQTQNKHCVILKAQ